MPLSWGRFSLDLSGRPRIMGILNTTPDSFSDGGMYLDPKAAIDRAMQMASEGAEIIDIGGISTRPGSEPVELEEEIRRTLPVIEAISAKLSIPVSIDTYNSEAARRALDAGAAIVNDISGLRFDPRMADVVARAGVPVVVMHIKGTPRDMQKDPSYEALVPEVMDYLRGSILIARDAGIRHVIIDPGIGFGKTFEQNIELVNSLPEFVKLGLPVLVGPSRKAFIGAMLGGASPTERMEGTAAVVTACVLGGAHIIRVHDVREMAKVVRAAHALRSGSMEKT